MQTTISGDGWIVVERDEEEEDVLPSGWEQRVVWLLFSFDHVTCHTH